MFGISCPTASLCVAVGGNNTVATSTDPAGGTDSWKVIEAGTGAAPSPGGFFNGHQLRSVDCPSRQLCVAVSFEGQILTSTDPTGGAGAWKVADLASEGPNIHFYGVSCPSVSFCAASAGGAKVATSTNPAGGASAWTVTQLQGPMELRGISCYSAVLCAAVGDDGDSIRPSETDQAVVVASDNPLGGAWDLGQLPGRRNLFGASCPAPDLCVSGDDLGNLLVASNPFAGSDAWRQIDGGGSVQITDVDCVSSTLCLAIDNNGDVLTSEKPAGGPGDWTFANLLPYPGVDATAANALWAASCPSRSFCAIAVNHGQIFTSHDPFVRSQEGTRSKQSRKRRPRPKRPRVRIARGPLPGIELDRGKLTVHFRFFALHHAQVRGFVCKLDKRPLKSCRSPKTYRVGYGRHHFRVRAVGWTGLRGPLAVHPFRVCHPMPDPQCTRRLPPTRLPKG